MDNYNDEFIIESEYFDNTIILIKAKLSEENDKNQKDRKKLIESRKEMWDNTVHFSDDFDKLIEINQYLQPLETQTTSYDAAINKTQRLENMLHLPYFARVDFTESGSNDKEKIYIGRSNLIDDKSHNIYVYDWRAPISSIFYRFELGNVQYEAPVGIITGEISLKRQYEINNGKLDYFFDANVQIVDEFLRKLLSKNASSKMKTIVETIQRDQDIVIRDIENDLLIVQGAAGSGKTSIALHRVAFLMYQGLASKLRANNIVIISPNALFGQYISEVLPDLGEENIESLIFEDVFKRILNSNGKMVQTRNQLLESLITCDDSLKKNIIKSSLKFKTSSTFIQILHRLIWYYEHKMIEFSDVYYNGIYIANRHLLKASLLKRNSSEKLAIRLKHIEKDILESVWEIRKDRIKRLEVFVGTNPEHMFEVIEFARLISIRESTTLLANIHKFTKVDYFNLYNTLFKDKELFYRIAKGLVLPDNIEQIINYTNESMNSDMLNYEDSLALLYLKLKIAGSNEYNDIKQIMVDEAQDYYPIHFEILKALFYNAKYTILGDFNQTIEKQEDISIYTDIQNILNKKKSIMISMWKSFRSTNEIISFSSKFINDSSKLESFSRSGDTPEVYYATDVTELDKLLINEINLSKKKGFKSVGILCKSTLDAKELYYRLKVKTEIKLIIEDSKEMVNGVFIIPIYMAKGLEFDVVLIYGTDDNLYKTEDDRKLLYIACTRALHRLNLFYSGEISRLL